MPVRLDHTIVPANDENASAAFLSSILGLPPPVRLGHFAAVHVGDTSLDFAKSDREIPHHHYAFLVSEVEFDQIFGRIRERGLRYWADPRQRKPNEINAWDDGRGVYFEDPNGHLLEILTRPYGSGGTSVDRPHPLIAPTIDAEKDSGPI